MNNENIAFKSATWHFDANANKNTGVEVIIDGIEMNVPLDPANRHYAEIMRQVKAGTLVIQPADEPEEQPVGE
jgi:hypothetical protein